MKVWDKSWKDRASIFAGFFHSPNETGQNIQEVRFCQGQFFS